MTGHADMPPLTGLGFPVGRPFSHRFRGGLAYAALRASSVFGSDIPFAGLNSRDLKGSPVVGMGEPVPVGMPDRPV